MLKLHIIAPISIDENIHCCYPHLKIIYIFIFICISQNSFNPLRIVLAANHNLD